MSTTFTVDDFIDVRIVAAGDDCAVYEPDPHAGGLRLSGVHRTATPAPFDLAEVPRTSLDEASNVPVCLVVHRSVFPGAIVTARPIGVLAGKNGAANDRWIVAVPAADAQFEALASVNDLPEDRRQALATSVLGDEGLPARWEPPEAAHAWIRQARQETWLARARQEKHGALRPAWKPLGYSVAGARRSSETEPNSEAEHAYHQLPHRFQKYVDEYLAPDERILYAVNRPMMKSAVRRSFLSRPTLQEGILFLTDQQLTLVTEIVPPGTANIRYGFIARTGPPERIEAIDIGTPNAETATLSVTWRACGGRETTVWEFPREAADELREVKTILAAWQPRPNDVRLRRATPPDLLDIPLRDPGANDPNDTAPLAARLETAIGCELAEGEQVLSRALIPPWLGERGQAAVLAVTKRRVLRLVDSDVKPHPLHAIDVRAITSIEWAHSILESYLLISHIGANRVQTERIVFPYTGTGFKECFLTLRRLMAIIVA
jgi:inorganic pyrophosphatase